MDIIYVIARYLTDYKCTMYCKLHRNKISNSHNTLNEISFVARYTINENGIQLI